MFITEPIASDPKVRSRKAAAITVAILVHLVLAVLFLLIAIIPAIKDEPDIVTQVVAAPRSPQPQMEKKSVMKQVEQATSAAAASPIAKMIRANTAAKIAAPEVTKVSDGQLGLGEGDFGSGFGSGAGAGMGGGATFFGSQSAGGLAGRLFDMKQDKERKAINYDPAPGSYFPKVKKVADSRFSESSLKGYYEAKVKLSFSFLAVPDLPADEGPKAFQADKEIEPRGWFVHYGGYIAPPRDNTEWRFHGFFDDCLIVFINNRPVFDGSWDSAMNEADLRQESELPRFVPSKPMWKGKWVRLKSGDRIDIVVGERPGGRMGGTLMIEEKDAGIKGGKLPLFSMMRIAPKDWTRVEETKYPGFNQETPVFRVVSKGF